MLFFLTDPHHLVVFPLSRGTKGWPDTSLLGGPTPFQLLSDFFHFSHDGIHLCLLLGPHAELLNCYDKLIFIFCKDSVFWDVCLPFL